MASAVNRGRTQTTPNNRRTDICNCCSAKLSSILNMIMKKTCPSCQRVVCPSCLVFTLKIPKALCVCKRCDRLSSVNFEPRHLMRLRGKELRDILIALDIPYTDGSEKCELVELIVRHRGGHLGWRPTHPPEPRPTNTTTGTRSLHASMDDLTSPLRATSSSVDLTTTTTTEPELLLQPHQPSSQVSDDEDKSSTTPNDKTITLDDIDDETAIQSLSIRQLKSILMRNSVDYKGCCEKWELEARVLQLWQINKQTAQDIESMPEEDLCRICMNAPIDCVMLECGHVATCTGCGRKMNECPICRQFVVRVVHIFKA